MTVLRENEYRLLQALVAGEDPVSVETLSEGLGLDQSLVLAAATWLQGEGLAEISETTFEEIRLDAAGEDAVARGLPERAVVQGLVQGGGAATMQELPALSGRTQQEVGQSLRFLQQKGWATKEGATLVVSPAGRGALGAEGPDEALLRHLSQAGTVTAEALSGDLAEGLVLLRSRKGFLRIRERTRRAVVATPRGHEAAPEAVLRPEVNQLTAAMLADGSWREVDFRPYDMSLATEPAWPGKIHPFRRILERTRKVFLELGFEEVASPFVESSFWDFDALFQPQDHPARDMQDTFYVARPGTTRLPEEAVVDTVRRTHENGGDTGSIGWGYRWNRDMAHRPVLRTHTTACTVRALAENPNPPRKVFCVGKVFRRETVDYKHLPVFYQVDGIIIDEHASFASLLGTLEAFYRKMGFERFQFRPAFFPYTEPSVEVFVYMEQKKDWVEMGGAGVFRPEVTEPFGCRVPVLAWGLGLERLAMFTYGLSDIRQLYVSDVQWLKEAELCR